LNPVNVSSNSVFILRSYTGRPLTQSDYTKVVLIQLSSWGTKLLETCRGFK